MAKDFHVSFQWVKRIGDNYTRNNEILATPKNIPILYLDLKKDPKMHRNDPQTSTPASNLGYLAPPPQDNFSWVPNCSLGPPGWETKVSSKKFGLGYVKLHGFYANPKRI